MRNVIGPSLWHATKDPYWGGPTGYVAIFDFAPLAECGQPGRGDGATRTGGVIQLADGATIPDGYTDLGDGALKDIAVNGKQRDAWESLFGFRPEGDHLVDWIEQQFTVGADPAGEASTKPLLPARGRRVNITFNNQVLVDRPFDWNSPHGNSVIATIKRDIGEQWDHEQSVDPKRPTAGTTQKMLDNWCEKAAVPKEQYKVFVPDRLKEDIPAPLKHETTFTETWPQADSTTISGNDQAWTEVAGDSRITSNRWRNVTTVGRAVARCDSDVSSVDHYIEAGLPTWNFAAGGNIGIYARFASAAETAYQWIQGNNAGNPENIFGKVVATVGSNLLVDSSGNSAWSTTTVKLVVLGGTLLGYNGGTLLLTHTDSSITSGTRCGLRTGFVSTPGNAEFDNITFSDGFPGPWNYIRQQG